MKGAKCFYELLSPLKGRYNDIAKEDVLCINTKSILNKINELNDIFHLVWTQSNNYPSNRMRHLLYIIDDYVAKFISLSLVKHIWSPFTASFGNFQGLIQKLMSIHNEWMEVRNNNLIKYFEQQPKRWKYAKNECKTNYIFKRLYERMNDVLLIRSLYKQINALTPTVSHFSVFEHMEADKLNTIWQCDDKNQALFNEAKEIWFKKMSKYIRMSGEKLEQRIKQISSQSPQLILAEFENFSVLLQQSAVSAQFESQKHKLLAQMNAHLECIKSEFEQLLSGHDDQLFSQNEMSATSQSV